MDRDTDIALDAVRARDGASASSASSGELVCFPQPGTGPGPPDQQLPLVDGGKDAWLFLAASWILEAFVWGFPFAFGVFQDYYSTHEPFAASPSIAVIGTCAMGILYLSTPVIMAFLHLYPRLGRWSPILGVVIMCTALVLTSFSTTTAHVIATQGVLYGLGGSIAYNPCVIWLGDWFVQRKGLAYGLLWSGTGVAGVVLPLLLEYLLKSHGFQTTLRAWATLVFVLATPLSYFIKPRLPPSTSPSLPSTARPFNLGVSWVFHRPVIVYQVANAIEAAGFFLPGIFLPSFARVTLGAGAFESALTVLLVNVASAVGTVVMGFLVDRFHVTTCILISTLGAAVATLCLWGLATNLAVLYVFCVAYGLFAGAFASSWPGVMREVTRSRSDDGDANVVFAFLALGRGLGNVASGPLREALISGFPSSWLGRAAGSYGTQYGILVAFTGLTALLGGASSLGRLLGWV